MGILLRAISSARMAQENGRSPIAIMVFIYTATMSMAIRSITPSARPMSFAASDSTHWTLIGVAFPSIMRVRRSILSSTITSAKTRPAQCVKGIIMAFFYKEVRTTTPSAIISSPKISTTACTSSKTPPSIIGSRRIISSITAPRLFAMKKAAISCYSRHLSPALTRLECPARLCRTLPLRFMPMRTVRQKFI